MRYVELAEQIARRAHAGQADKQGDDYILHPARVATRVSGGGDLARAVAWLHDVVEDTEETAASLTKAGLPWAVVEAVLVLTRTEGEAYTDYIDRIARSGNAVAVQVKLADLWDNLRVGEAFPSLAARYLAAIETLVKKL